MTDGPAPTGWLAVRVDFLAPRDCARIAYALRGLADATHRTVTEVFLLGVADALTEYGQDLSADLELRSFGELAALGDDAELRAWLTPDTPPEAV